MQKVSKYILFLVACFVVFSSSVYAACSEESAKVTLNGNRILEGLRIMSYGALNGGGVDSSATYGVSSFTVKFDDRPGSYYGYCLDPGFYFPSGNQNVCCSAVRSDKYSKGVTAGFIYLSKLAGNARRSPIPDEQYIVATDMALRFYAMATGIASSTSTTTGSSFNQMTNYLQLLSNLLKQGENIYGGNQREINDYVSKRLKETIYRGYSIQSFVSGANAEAYATAAYALFREAINVKNIADKMYYASTTEADISIDGTESAVSCSDDTLALIVNTNDTVQITDVIVNNDSRVRAYVSGNRIIIDKSAIFESSQCNSGAVTITLTVKYRGGREENLYMCKVSHGKNVQKILTYVGEQGNASSFDTSLKTYNYTLTIPSSCVPYEWSEQCVTGGYGRCLPTGYVEIKSSINNCCVDPNDANTSVVTDSLIEKTVEDPLNIDDIFLPNPELRRKTLMSIVKCGLQALTYAEDFRTTSPDADLSTMRAFCQMYCMERTKIITPPPVTVTAGRYFELDFTKFDIHAERQCRISVDFAEFIKQYINAILSENSFYNSYYNNMAHYYYYRAGEDNSLVGMYRIENAMQIVKIECTRNVGTVHCPTGDKYASRPMTAVCPTVERTCSINYDRINASDIDVDSFPMPFASISTDAYVGGSNPRFAYGLGNSFINVNVRVSRSKVGYSKPLIGNYWSLAYKNDTCIVGPYAAAGSPKCTCPDGSRIPTEIAHCEDVPYLSATADCNTPSRYGHYACTSLVCDRVHNFTYNFKTNNHYTCKFTEGYDEYLYLKGDGYYPQYEAHMAGFKSGANSAFGGYQSALSRIKVIEASMHDCFHFFNEGYYGAVNLENHYDVSKIETSFEYDQVYSNESGQHATMTVSGSIVPHCEVELIRDEMEFDPDFGLLYGEYDSKFGSSKLIRVSIIRSEYLPYNVGSLDNWQFRVGNTVMSAFYNAVNTVSISSPYISSVVFRTFGPSSGLTGFNILMHSPVNGKVYLPQDSTGKILFPKYVTLDGTYKVNCTFDDTNNRLYTLEPGGYTSSNPLTNNYVTHDQLLGTFLTTYAGKHEILYHISGLGSQVQRQFDSYFQKGSTCSGRNSGAYNAPASCYFDVTQKLVSTGVCEGVASSSNYKDVCRITCAGNSSCDSIYNFMFKIAEPSDLFPTDIPPYEDPAGWGKNWLTERGNDTRESIELDGKNDLTYSPERMTYSFVLTPKTIEAIKEYNNYRFEAGGYNDFNLSCDCGIKGSHNCVRCISTFVTDLAQTNSINSINDSYVATEDIWANDKNIQIVRNGNSNWDRDTTPQRPVLH